MTSNKEHWEHIYAEKETANLSWYQQKPVTSLAFIEELQIKKDAKIIDVGGGDSYLADYLLDLGYTNITVLDISHNALEKAKKRLGNRASQITWIVADAANFTPNETYDFWHDRAAFHFLTDEHSITTYIETIQNNLSADGKLVIGTFSENGPTKCSGLNIRQYSETDMANVLQKYFHKIKCVTVNHKTPFNTLQNFIFCSFKKQAL